ncbi:M13 family metallopeptidase [Sphingomonas oryzagri]|uniref:M13 family metallopeptidase n=1 Tax=Sphingomonas oryzagri TaxID=3042314 RepID=A0ABT6MZS9_9SPHN|nr:M13 family metallopeptidase [Sphingomonas oryzagri]MDH7637984.1 M13 family metallopeptidase [Sphingomonas oryzagri]
MRLTFVALLASTMLAGAAVAAQPDFATPVVSGGAPAVAGQPTYGTFGFDTAGMDKSVKPGDNFYDYASGTWQKTTEIPADRSSYGMFHKLQDLSLARTRGILEDAEKQPDSKIGMFYASFMDEAAADKKGATPIKPWLADIKAVKDKAALGTEMAKLSRLGVTTPFGTGVGQDDKAPDTYIAQFGQDGLGLPNRDYYLKDDAALVKNRAAYVAYVTKLLTLAGEPNAAARAQAIMAFETEIAKVHWAPEDTRDADKVYNKWARADFDAKAPGFPWATYMTGLGYDGQKDFLVAEPTAFTGEAKLFASTPLAVLKDYMIVRTLDDYARYLSKDFVDTQFAFHGTELSGTPQNQPRWKRGVSLVSGGMGEEIGKVYVAKYFPPEAKAAADALVHNIIAAMGARIKNLAWMAPETKQKALEKLAAFTPKIGYPDKWRDYSTLVIKPGDLVGNVARSNEFEYQRDLNKLGKPIDRGEWFMTPMTINAYANPVMNEIVFPAAILQPPFFDPKADPAVNYGGIGVVIGHEISHHFDDQGRKYDAHGMLTDWWTPQDVTRFTAMTDQLVKQYDAYEPLPGLHVNGKLTLGENMADLAGLAISHDAYELSLGGKPAPTIDGFTADQRFYLGYAQVWRTKYREPTLRRQVLTDPHSPGAQRTDEVRNKDLWYKAFDVKPGDKLYLAPDQRVNVW